MVKISDPWNKLTGTSQMKALGSGEKTLLLYIRWKEMRNTEII